METVPLTGLSHIQILVSDLDSSVAWYERALGLTELRADRPRYVAMWSESGGFRVVLTAGRPPDAHGQVDHVAFRVADRAALDAWAERLTAEGIDHDGVVANIVGRSLDLFDPDGTNIELVVED